MYVSVPSCRLSTHPWATSCSVPNHNHNDAPRTSTVRLNFRLALLLRGLGSCARSQSPPIFLHQGRTVLREMFLDRLRRNTKRRQYRGSRQTCPMPSATVTPRPILPSPITRSRAEIDRFPLIGQEPISPRELLQAQTPSIIHVGLPTHSAHLCSPPPDTRLLTSIKLIC